jgi:hypothetical protein
MSLLNPPAAPEQSFQQTVQGTITKIAEVLSAVTGDRAVKVIGGEE